MFGKIEPCKNCGGKLFGLTVKREDKITMDSYGDVEDKEGTDSISGLSCTSCGVVAIVQDKYTEEQAGAIYWELERQVLET